jgi:hypothetical protein
MTDELIICYGCEYKAEDYTFEWLWVWEWSGKTIRKLVCNDCAKELSSEGNTILNRHNKKQYGEQDRTRTQGTARGSQTN